MATVILAVAVIAVAQAVAKGAGQTLTAREVQRAQALSTALMEEILALPTMTAGTVTLRNQTTINGFHLTETAGHVVDAAGVLYSSTTGYQDFSRTASVAAGTVTLPGVATPVAALTITVTVTDAKGWTWTLTRSVPQ